MHGNGLFFPLAGMVLGTALATAAVAQPEDPYRACDTLADPVKRLACYDEVRAQHSRAADIDADTDSTVTPPAENGLGQTEPSAESATGTAKPEIETIGVPPTATSSGEPEPSVEPEPASNIDKFGLKRDSIKSIESVVARIETNYAKERTFYLSNGQVWREMWHDRTRVSENDTVMVQRSLTGAYFLKIGKYSTRVERIE